MTFNRNQPKKKMNRNLLVAFTFIIGLSILNTTILADEKDEASAFLNEELLQLVDVINSDILTPTAKRAMTERQIRAHLALGHMAIESLGAQAALFNLQEFADFSKEFEDHLLHFYLQRAATFVGESIDITDTSFNAETGEIIIRTQGGERGTLFKKKSSPSSHRATVDYHLAKFEDRWQIVQIVIDGVNVTTNFRSQFKSVLQRKSPESIIAQLRKSNAEKEKKNPFDG